MGFGPRRGGLGWGVLEFWPPSPHVDEESAMRMALPFTLLLAMAAPLDRGCDDGPGPSYFPTPSTSPTPDFNPSPEGPSPSPTASLAEGGDGTTSPDGTPTGFEMPTDGENGVDSPFCAENQPLETCPCAVPGAVGCVDDGFTHEEALVCIDGLWVNLAGTAAANAYFCPEHPDFVYNFCAWIEGEVWANCTL